MKWISILIVGFVFFMELCSCHHNDQPVYPNTQVQFADDPNFRIGKWYSITDSGTIPLAHNTKLDTIWFINDTLAGWTGFVPYQPHAYAFFKTYISPQSIYNMVYIAPDPFIAGQMDTEVHQFGFTPKGDTLTFYWPDPSTYGIIPEEYVKMK